MSDVIKCQVQQAGAAVCGSVCSLYQRLAQFSDFQTLASSTPKIPC